MVNIERGFRQWVRLLCSSGGLQLVGDARMIVGRRVLARRPCWNYHIVGTLRCHNRFGDCTGHNFSMGLNLRSNLRHSPAMYEYSTIR
jgi:hypothetical protein